jgi:transposase
MIFNTLAATADTEWLMIDSTIVRAHQCASGAKGGRKIRHLGRSCGGFTTKIHALCDALGNPLRFVLTGGERHDSTQALPLLDGMRGDYVLADKGYDADYIAKAAENIGAQAVIPSRSNSKNPRVYDAHLYKERNHIERLFGKLKQFRTHRHTLRQNRIQAFWDLSTSPPSCYG